MIKIQNNKQTKIYKGEQDFEQLQNYILKSFNLQPEQYNLSYKDEENDIISVSCTEDINSLAELPKFPKLQINLVEQIQKDHQEQKEQTQSETLNNKKQNQDQKRCFKHLRFQQTEEEQKKREELRQQRLLKRQEKLTKMFQQQQQEQASKEQKDQEDNQDQRKKQRQEKRQKQIQKFFEEIKKDENLSQTFTLIQKSLKKAMPLFQDFLSQEFQPKKQSNQQENDQQEQEQVEKVEVQTVKPKKQEQKPVFKTIKSQYEQKSIHRNIRCDGCRAFPVIGNRYKCQECPDFDFCQDCHTNKLSDHEHKQFEIFQKPQQRMNRCRSVHVLGNFLQKQKNESLQEKSQEKKVNEEKPQKMIYSPKVQQLAKKVQEVLGGEESKYYQVCKENKNKSIDAIVNILLQ